MTDIFLTDKDPVVCAETLCDQHLLLQITHVSSILSYLVRGFGVTDPMYGEPAPVSNEIIVWAQAKEERAIWLGMYSDCLIREYESRFGVDDFPEEFGPISLCNKLLIMLFECGKEEEDLELEVPNIWWKEDPFESYKKQLTEELTAISCAWTKSYPPYWLKKSGIQLTRKGDRIFKQ